eukprot:TRINITY_DN388_c0_g1_i8.p1 TRINITY_DN388_c0_g1~~TRINITY_DN388_c0_g1_i8.p1  ORF type:complete len:197 (-),score=22.61 TRINITY_DN388_c0_g1_i8:50-640(-)
MQASIIIFLSLLVLAVVSQTPTQPIWPRYFSASVAQHHYNNREPPRFFRWFYDSAKNKDRFDGVVDFADERIWAQAIFDHTIQRETVVFFQQSTVSCYYRSINSTLPKPNLTNLQYIGVALIDDLPVYHWIENDRTRGVTFQYYETIRYREPKRIDVSSDREDRSETWLFYEFNVCSQDPELYDVPAFIRATCTRF